MSDLEDIFGASDPEDGGAGDGGVGCDGEERDENEERMEYHGDGKVTNFGENVLGENVLGENVLGGRRSGHAPRRSSVKGTARVKRQREGENDNGEDPGAGPRKRGRPRSKANSDITSSVGDGKGRRKRKRTDADADGDGKTVDDDTGARQPCSKRRKRSAGRSADKDEGKKRGVARNVGRIDKAGDPDTVAGAKGKHDPPKKRVHFADDAEIRHSVKRILEKDVVDALPARAPRDLATPAIDELQRRIEELVARHEKTRREFIERNVVTDAAAASCVVDALSKSGSVPADAPHTTSRTDADAVVVRHELEQMEDELNRLAKERKELLERQEAVVMRKEWEAMRRADMLEEQQRIETEVFGPVLAAEFRARREQPRAYEVLAKERANMKRAHQVVRRADERPLTDFIRIVNHGPSRPPVPPLLGEDAMQAGVVPGDVILGGGESLGECTAAVALRASAVDGTEDAFVVKGDMNMGEYEGIACKFCGKGIVTRSQESGCMSCNYCGRVHSHVVFAEDMSFKEKEDYEPPPKKARGNTSGGYRPPNHFAEIVAQLQGKRRAMAPKPIFDLVEHDIKRYKVHERGVRITATFVRELLKKRRKSEAYKYCTELAAAISNKPAPYMTPMQEERILNLFPLTVIAYRESPRYKRRQANRVGRIKDAPNNMNYNYVFYKLCQLLSHVDPAYEDFLPYIPLPKSDANIDDNDENGWRFVCEYNGWTYYPTR